MNVDPHEAYFQAALPEMRLRLEAVQTEVERLLPAATRCIGYKMPAFKARRIFLYFAAFKGHIGVYPPVRHDAALIQELQPFRGEKGNLSFPHQQPLPLELIGRVALALHREVGST